MPMITCPECKRQISDKADFCPHCGLPSKYFVSAVGEHQKDAPLVDIPVDYKNLPNLILSFDRDYVSAFGKNNYITSGDKSHMLDSYAACYAMLSNDLIFQYVRSNAAKFKVDLQLATSFLRKYAALDRDIDAHNERYDLALRLLSLQSSSTAAILQTINGIIKRLEAIPDVQDELSQWREMQIVAESVKLDAKAEKLLTALKLGFALMKKCGAAKKAVIFTESVETQKMLFALLLDTYKTSLYNGASDYSAMSWNVLIPER